MWKLWHKLIGWEYAVVEFAGQEIRRIHKTPNGVMYFNAYGSRKLLTKRNFYFWLTKGYGDVT